MMDINISISISGMSLNVNGLKSPDQRLSDSILKQTSTVYCPYKTHFNIVTQVH